MVASSASIGDGIDLGDNQMMARWPPPRTTLLGFPDGLGRRSLQRARVVTRRAALPRVDAERQIVVNNLASFAEAWSLERDEVYVFALARSSSRPWC